MDILKRIPSDTIVTAKLWEDPLDGQHHISDVLQIRVMFEQDGPTPDTLVLVLR